ncbi:MAG: NAD(P)-dependent oxidoreductase [Bacillota bacterium]
MKLVLLEPLSISSKLMEKYVHLFQEKGHEFVFYEKKAGGKELKERCSDADVLIVANMPLPSEIILACPRLKMISVAFTGVDHIGMDACKEREIIVSNSAGYSTHSVAELTFGLIFSVLRKLPGCDTLTREGKTKDGMIGRELYGKTLGIIGTGAIGLKVAEIGRIFGCNVVAYSRTVREEGIKLGVKYLSLDELLTTSDIITIHVPLTDETRNLIDEKKLSLIKPTAILINTARGPVIDNSALAQAIANKKIAGAGLDVFEIEPPLPLTHPLLNLPDVVVTPHIGYATQEAFERRAEIVFSNILAWMEGNPRNIVN